MTVNKVISRLDELRPNAASTEVKAAWCIALDSRLRCELLDLPASPISFPEDADSELTATPPYDELYILYCAAMLDLISGDTARYANSMAAFEKLLDAYARQAAKSFSLPAEGFRNVRL